MNVRNCKKCGKIFNYVSGAPICPACKEALEKKFAEVKEYVREHRNCTVQDVVENCEVEQAQVQQWVREERLMFTGGPSGLFCEKCGSPIPMGRFCEKCKQDMANSFSEASSKKGVAMPTHEKAKDSSTKMRFLDR